MASRTPGIAAVNMSSGGQQTTSKSSSYTTTTTTTTTTTSTSTSSSRPRPKAEVIPQRSSHQPNSIATAKTPLTSQPDATTKSDHHTQSTTQIISIRHAKFSDLWPAAQLLARAFADEPLFGTIIHPNRHLHPTHPALWFYSRLLTDWFDASQTFLLATTTPHPTSKSPSSRSSNTITGIAQWTRNGPRSSLLHHSWTHPRYDPRTLLFPIARLFTRHLISPLLRHLNRALSPQHDTILESADRHVSHYWTGPHAESFYLHILGVDPAYQHLGIGRQLVDWGMRRGREEGVSVSVIAAEGKDVFYRRCGFETCVGNAGDGRGNPLCELGVPGGNIWFRDWEEGEFEGHGEGKGYGEADGGGGGGGGGKGGGAVCMRGERKGVVEVFTV